MSWSTFLKRKKHKANKVVTKQDFGFDIERGRQWGREHPEISGMKPEPPSQVEDVWRSVIRCQPYVRNLAPPARLLAAVPLFWRASKSNAVLWLAIHIKMKTPEVLAVNSQQSNCTPPRTRTAMIMDA